MENPLSSDQRKTVSSLFLFLGICFGAYTANPTLCLVSFLLLILTNAFKN